MHSLLFLPLQEMSVGYANGIRVMSMTHTGEPGFMLYIPIEVRVPGVLAGTRDGLGWLGCGNQGRLYARGFIKLHW